MATWLSVFCLFIHIFFDSSSLWSIEAGEVVGGVAERAEHGGCHRIASWTRCNFERCLPGLLFLLVLFFQRTFSAESSKICLNSVFGGRMRESGRVWCWRNRCGKDGYRFARGGFKVYLYLSVFGCSFTLLLFPIVQETCTCVCARAYLYTCVCLCADGQAWVRVWK